MKKGKVISAVRAEQLFIGVIVLLIAIIIANFALATNLLSSQSKQADRTKIEAEVSNSDIEIIESAGQKLSDDPDAVQRAEALVAESRLYQYQNQIINDLQGYAARSSTKISGYSFSSGADAGSTEAAPAANAAPPAASQPGATSAPAGLSSTSVSISIDQNVSYINFLKFLKLIENNITRMQITDLSLTPDSENRKLLINPTLTIKVYTR